MTESLTDRELDAWIAEHVMGDMQLAACREYWEQGKGGLGPRTFTGVLIPGEIPDYTADLNACAQAEAKIAKLGLQDEYIPHLASTCFPGDGEDNWFLYCFGLTIATARQRCEAIYTIRKQIKAARQEG